MRPKATQNRAGEKRDCHRRRLKRLLADLALKLLHRFHPLVTGDEQAQGRMAVDRTTMSKIFRRDRSNEPGHPVAKSSRRKSGSKGPWEFTSSGRLFAMGATDSVRRAAYRAADGEMRFLPL
jgi:hypothetical protein